MCVFVRDHQKWRWLSGMYQERVFCGIEGHRHWLSRWIKKGCCYGISLLHPPFTRCGLASQGFCPTSKKSNVIIFISLTWCTWPQVMASRHWVIINGLQSAKPSTVGHVAIRGTAKAASRISGVQANSWYAVFSIRPCSLSECRTQLELLMPRRLEQVFSLSYHIHKTTRELWHVYDGATVVGNCR